MLLLLTMPSHYDGPKLSDIMNQNKHFLPEVDYVRHFGHRDMKVTNIENWYQSRVISVTKSSNVLSRPLEVVWGENKEELEDKG